MLSQLEHLSLTTDGRYATDRELMFLQTYLKSARTRFSAYQRLQKAEVAIVDQVYQKLQAMDSTLLLSGSMDLSAKWKRDTVRVLRYAATALLIDDTETYRERFLMWFQTIMQSFRAERSCNVTYTLMQEVIRQHLPPQEADLVLPLLELSRSMLGFQKS